jgi:hypothetical protein
VKDYLHYFISFTWRLMSVLQNIRVDCIFCCKCSFWAGKIPNLQCWNNAVESDDGIMTWELLCCLNFIKSIQFSTWRFWEVPHFQSRPITLQQVTCFSIILNKHLKMVFFKDVLLLRKFFCLNVNFSRFLESKFLDES